MDAVDLVTRLRDHDRHAVHDHDDDCNEAADEIERLRVDVLRYRWLRDVADPGEMTELMCIIPAQEFDAWIDERLALIGDDI